MFSSPDASNRILTKHTNRVIIPHHTFHIAHSKCKWNINNQEVPKMKLHSNVITPFGRKITVALGVLGLTDQVTMITTDTNDPEDENRRHNPLGKIPTLVADGEAIFDSRVIMEYLDGVHGGNVLLPRDSKARIRTQIRAAQIDGTIDAAILVVYEDRFRPPEGRSASWVAYQRDKVIRSLLAMETSGMMGDYQNGASPDMAEIGLGCLLDYLDFRNIVPWRDHAPSLVKWHDDFCAALPLFVECRPS